MPVGMTTITGHLLSILVSAFLLLDGVMKAARARQSVETTVALGFDAARVPLLGALLILCTLLYAVPRTAPLGAVLLTAYLGDAVTIQLQNGNPVFSRVLFGVYVGILMWAGLWLRSTGLRGLFAFW
ncbi:MAG: DoxX family protein [Porphyrobacter sp.]|nr:DoxX family protein [Porphyrobacter sp.]